MPSPGNAVTLAPLRDVIRRHGLLARKSLGQHFLLDANITEKIVRIAGDLRTLHIIEIAPVLAASRVRCWAATRSTSLSSRKMIVAPLPWRNWLRQPRDA